MQSINEFPQVALSTATLSTFNQQQQQQQQGNSYALQQQLAEPYETLSAGASQLRSGAVGTTARSRQSHSARSPQPHNTESELAAIRRELQEMHRDVTRDVEMTQVQEELSSEIQTLYEELQRAALKLEAERSLRRKIEAELENVRQDRLTQTSAIVQELDSKRSEIQILRDERVELKQWLDRGAAECRRVADEVISLRKSLEISEKNCDALKDESSRLSGVIQRLTDQLNEMQFQIETLQKEKAVLEVRVKESQEGIRIAEISRNSSSSEVMRLESDMLRLQQRVRGAVDAEHALNTLCHAVRQLISEVGSLDRHVKEGSVSERFDKPLVYVPPSAVEDDDERQDAARQDLALSSKLLITRLLEAVRVLEVDVKRFMQDKQRERTDSQRAHQDELAALHREKEIVLAKYNNERAALEKRQGDLEKELMEVAAGVQETVQAEVAKRLQHLDELIAKNRELQDANAVLRARNDQLTQQSKKLRIDWEKVDESRIRLQQLQMELTMMQEYSEKLNNENRNLRLLIQRPIGRGAADDATLSDGSGLGLGADDVRVGGVGATSKKQQQAFDEWRRLMVESTPAL